MGYDTWGSDISRFGVEKARELSERLGHEIPFVLSSWQELSRNISRRFEAIFNDGFLGIPSLDEMRKCVSQFYRVLRKRGIFVFAGPTEWSPEDNRKKSYEEAKRKLRRFSPHRPFRRGDETVYQVTLRQVRYDRIRLIHVYLLHGPRGVRVEHVVLDKLFRWSWRDLRDIFDQVGFSDIHSEKIVVDSEERVFNVAIK
jgi:SAM-dependent methyltransferase